MDDHEFDTICLDSNICDICNQDTGEELINCILNDRCLKVGDGTSSTLESTEPFKQAHKYCLDRWKSVIQSTLHPKCPSPKRSWKDKFKDLLNRNLENTSNFDAWVEVDNLKSTTETTTTTQFLGDSSTQSSSDINENSASITTKKNSFLTREEYRVEQLNVDIEECRERGRKLRVRSVDIEDEDESPSNNHYGNLEREEKSWTKEQCKAVYSNRLGSNIKFTVKFTEFNQFVI